MACFDPKTPRQSAAVHLPELAELRELTQSVLQSKLVYLTTPDGEWGTVPEWTRWPMVRGDEFAPQSPVTPQPRSQGKTR
jgi:hypothetical protein